MEYFKTITEAQKYFEKEVESGASSDTIFMAKCFPLMMKLNLEISRKLTDYIDFINSARINSHSESNEGTEQQANRTGDDVPEPVIESRDIPTETNVVYPAFEKFLEENRTSVMYFSTDKHRDYFRKKIDESVIPESRVREFFEKVVRWEK